jgi:hypothetical protein
MGPLRTGLTAAAILIPGSAWAEVCDKMRPGWTPGTEATMFTEAIALSMTLPSLVLFLATLACFRFRLQWPALAVVVGWTIWVSVVSFLQPGDQRALAQAEGCIGSPTLFILIAGALSVGLILYTAPRDDKGTAP